MIPNHLLVATAVAMAVLVGLYGCSTGDDAAQHDHEQLADDRRQTVSEEREDDMIIERVDTTGDGEGDIIRHFEEYEDPRQEGRMRRRLRVMEVDTNTDGNIDVRREYDEYGNIEREENDQSLDGNIDTVLEFTGGELTRKKIMADDGERAEERRIYYDGRLVRVERDDNENGEIDRWEYYEEGVLMRVGLDTTGDGSADTWQMR